MSTPSERIARNTPATVSALGAIAATWAAAGLIGLLAFAMVRLSWVVVDGAEAAWDWRHWAVALGNGVFMAWSEGYRGFQLRFSPRSAARVKWLAHHPTPMRMTLAPLFAMGYFDATPRRLVGVYALTAFVVAAIVAVHALPQPWRAALDIGVIIGLGWGVASFAWSLRQVFAAPGFPVSPELGARIGASSQPAP